MLEFKKDVAAYLPVSLVSSTGAPVTGVGLGAVSVACSYGNGTSATISPTSWTELAGGALDGSGTYQLGISAADLSVAGPLVYVVKATGADLYKGLVKIVDREEVDTYTLLQNAKPYVSFLGGGETEAPVIYRVTAPTRNQVLVTYSEPVQMSTDTGGALNLANYVIAGLSVSSVEQTSEVSVRLVTSLQTPGATYNLTISNVQDLNGNVIV